jgi:hypothetical protein
VLEAEEATSGTDNGVPERFAPVESVAANR